MKDLSLHILDIAQNSLRANADCIEIHINLDFVNNHYTIVVKDNGSGMDLLTSHKVSDPFFTTRKTRKVGLGIPLLKQNTERTGGSFTIESEPGTGTTITSKSVLNHIDLLPEGDIGSVIALLISANPAIQFIFSYSAGEEVFTLDTKAIREILGEVSISDPEVRSFIHSMINENIHQLRTENKFA